MKEHRSKAKRKQGKKSTKKKKKIFESILTIE